MRELTIALILLITTLTCSSAAYLINSDFNRLEVRSLELGRSGSISAIMYLPKGGEKLPAAVLVHGVSSSKESMSALALELARRGIASLCLDAQGHGDSGGYLNLYSDPTLGINAALEYLRSQPFIDQNSIILIGHSLGASAVRSSADRGAVAHVLIGGGLSSSLAALEKMNSTFPRNLLIVVGTGDVLFELEALKDDLTPAFGVRGRGGKVYGDFEKGTARKLVTPTTTHLLEPLDPETVSEVVNWVLRSTDKEANALDLVYPSRDLLMLFSLLRRPTRAPIQLAFLRGDHEEVETSFLKLLIAWGLPSFLLFLPSFLMGLLIPFPQVLFANSVALWFALSSAYGLLLKRKELRRIRFKPSELLVPVMIFAAMYSLLSLLKLLYGMNLWVYVPLLRALDLRRAFLFLYFLPFSLAFFYTESLLLSGGSFLKLLGVRLLPMSLALLLQYASMFVLSVKPLPSLLGFSLEFLPLMLPLFAISTTIIWWFRKLGSPSAGILMNSLLFSWASASVFPFGGF
ncbi:MAG: alpha/beta fold hydrolase [Candidatus Korarchaeum sp.]|nr:alpha/beta fold hydrolase [Candidatus Korarchaeum sp.]